VCSRCSSSVRLKTMKLLMLASVGGKPRKLVVVGGKCMVYHMCVLAVVSMEGMPLRMVTMSMLLGRSQA
jgi:hypothetical protein